MKAAIGAVTLVAVVGLGSVAFAQTPEPLPPADAEPVPASTPADPSASDPAPPPAPSPTAQPAPPAPSSPSPPPVASAPVAYAPPPAPPPGEDTTVHTHDGVYVRLGIGPGFLSDSATIKGGANQTDYTMTGFGGVIDFAVGGTPAPGLVLAGTIQEIEILDPTVESDGNTSTAGEDPVMLSVLGIQVDWYFDPTGGAHAFGMLGWGDLTRSDEEDEADSANGPVAGLGVGYEWWVAEQWGIGVLGQVTYANATWKSDDVDLEDNHSLFVPALMFSATHH